MKKLSVIIRLLWGLLLLSASNAYSDDNAYRNLGINMDLIKQINELAGLSGYLDGSTCELFSEHRLACAPAGNFDNCMRIRLDVDKNKYKQLKKMCGRED